MKHSEEERRKALEVYLETRSVTKAIRLVGLQVSCGHFYRWIKEVQVSRAGGEAIAAVGDKA